MSGHRDDGSYAEDRAHHEGRKIRRRDDAPAGGIKRPEMESCAGCGENTPKGSGSCADCK